MILYKKDLKTSATEDYDDDKNKEEEKTMKYQGQQGKVWHYNNNINTTTMTDDTSAKLIDMDDNNIEISASMIDFVL